MKISLDHKPLFNSYCSLLMLLWATRSQYQIQVQTSIKIMSLQYIFH